MRTFGLGLMAIVLVGCGGKERDQRLDALQAEVDALSAQQASDLAAAQEALQAELAELRGRFDAFDPAEAGVLAAEIDALDATVQATSADLIARMDALETEAVALGERVSALEEADVVTAETLTTIQADVSDNYVTAASIEGVVRVSDLQPDYEDVQTLVADLLDARDRVVELEESGADAEEVSALADALTALTDEVGGLADVDAGLDTRLATVEADYLTSAELASVQSDVDAISADYLTSSDLTPVQSAVDTISADYVTSAGLAPLQADVDAIAGDYVSESRFTTLESSVAAISADYVTSDIFAILEGDVDTISSDYLTSDDYVDLAEQIEATESLVLLPTPQIIRLACNGTASTQTRSDVEVSAVPNDASALVVNLFTFNDTRDDHVNHHFGRTVINGTTWDNQPYERNIPMSDVSVTHQGDLSGDFYYGQGHGSSLIPLKANGTFDASMCRGYSRGTHYVTIQVNGYYR